MINSHRLLPPLSTVAEAEAGILEEDRLFNPFLIRKSAIASADFWWSTNSSKIKLDGIESGAEVNPTGAEIKNLYELEPDTNPFTDADKTKLDNLPSSVQSDWNETDTLSGAFISNKPFIPNSTDHILEGSNLYFTQARVSANVDVIANTAKVSASGSVTTHSDVTGAGSGVIISSTERTKLGGIESGAQVNLPFGAVSNTVTQGNDARLSNSREWTASTISTAEAQGGTATTRRAWNALRVREAIAAYTEPFTSAEKTKLSGLNSANYLPTGGTAANSQLLDNLDSSQFLRSDASDTLSGSLTITGYSYVDEIINRTGTQLILNAGESFGKVSGQTAERIYLNSEDGISINTPTVANWGSGYGVNTAIITGENIDLAGNTVWHEGNLVPSVAASNDTIVQRHSSGYIYANYFNTTPNTVSSGVTQVCVETGNDGFIRHGNATAIRSFIGATSLSNPNTPVMRDGVGDINARLFRSEYDSTNSSIGFIMTQVDTASNNYIRPSTPAQFRTSVTDGYYLGISAKATDSNLLDGVDSGSFLRSNAVDTATELIRFSGLQTPSSIATSTGSLAGIELYSTSTTPAFLAFHRPGTYACYLGLDVDNKLKVGGWSMGANAYEIWHSGNHGSGSGLNADLWDGQEFSTYLNQPVLTTSSPTFGEVYGNWFRSTGNRGWLSATYGGGIYMIDTTWVRTYNGKAFYSSSSSTATSSTGSGAIGCQGVRIGDGNIAISGSLRQDATNNPLVYCRNASFPGYELLIGGWASTNSNNISRIRNSENLHIDSAANGKLYLNWYTSGPVYTSSMIYIYNRARDTVLGDIGSDFDNFWLRINQDTAKNIYTPRMIRADGGFQVDGKTVVSADGNTLYENNVALTSKYVRKDIEDTVGVWTRWADNVGIRIGTGADYRIWHNGASTLNDNYTGNTYYRSFDHGKGHYFKGESTGGLNRTLCSMTTEGVNLYYQGAIKIKTTSTGVQVTGSVAEVSSRNLKNEKRELRKCVEQINKLRPIMYSFKSDPTNRVQPGFIAEEVPNTLAIKHTSPEGYCLAYSQLTAWLVGAVQEIDHRLCKLEKKGGKNVKFKR